jgi:two-component system, LuxR family, response regulator FixJ
VNLQPTVFIVEDDPAELRSLIALVQGVFPHVEGFAATAEFCKAYHPPRPGCLVLDGAPHAMSGLELQQKLKAVGTDLPVIFITSHGNVQMAVEAMHAGAVTVLEKPFCQQELCNSIHTALELDAENRRRASVRQEVEQRLARLTVAEREVLKLILDGKLNKEIASQLNLSIRTVEDRRARLMKKMEAASLAELVRLVLRQ